MLNENKFERYKLYGWLSDNIYLNILVIFTIEYLINNKNFFSQKRYIW